MAVASENVQVLSDDENFKLALKGRLTAPSVDALDKLNLEATRFERLWDGHDTVDTTHTILDAYFFENEKGLEENGPEFYYRTLLEDLSKPMGHSILVGLYRIAICNQHNKKKDLFLFEDDNGLPRAAFTLTSQEIAQTFFLAYLDKTQLDAVLDLKNIVM